MINSKEESAEERREKEEASPTLRFLHCDEIHHADVDA
ncbi:predicted protein [Botrytis cinerea T4]|uniref:Uncharacterized protein n=1 Tax=Botryotinia fuckeliana (strain T4) TaxID=999810 RepID=G2YUM5_BOTF4|nr:predicted protein [Botrytis cinerea T4]